jgi:hypothetical protein
VAGAGAGAGAARPNGSYKHSSRISDGQRRAVHIGGVLSIFGRSPAGFMESLQDPMLGQLHGPIVDAFSFASSGYLRCPERIKPSKGPHFLAHSPPLLRCCSDRGIAVVCLLARAIEAARCYLNSPYTPSAGVLQLAYIQAYGLSLGGEGSCLCGLVTSAT